VLNERSTRLNLGATSPKRLLKRVCWTIHRAAEWTLNSPAGKKPEGAVPVAAVPKSEPAKAEAKADTKTEVSKPAKLELSKDVVGRADGRAYSDFFYIYIKPRFW
jgi:hypothetical protein